MNIHSIESGSRPNGAELRPQPTTRVSRNGAMRRVLLVAGLTFSLLAAPLTAPTTAAAGDSAEVVGREGGLGAAAGLSSLIYAPAKLLYATGGLVVGAFAWVFTAGDSEVASKVFTRSLKGTYVITPAMLTGDESVQFIGREESELQAPIGAVASAQPVPSENTAPSYGIPAPVSAGSATSRTYSETQPNYDDLGW
jgi:hypothetical protein